MDKVNTFPLAERNGLTLIKTWHLKGGDPLPEGIVYPCFVKGANSTTSTKVVMFICANEDKLRAVIREGGVVSEAFYMFSPLYTASKIWYNAR